MYRLIFVVAACLAQATARGESLDEAIAMARRANPQIAAATAEAASAIALRTASERARLPSVAVDAGWSRLGHSPQLDMQTAAGRLLSPPIFRNDQLRSASAMLTVPLFSAGRIDRSIAAQRAEADAAGATAAATDADVRLAVVDAYLGVLRAHAAAQVADAQVEALAAHYARVDRLYALSGVPRTDWLAASASLESARADRVQAVAARQDAEDRYNTLLGEPLGRRLELEEPPSLTAVGRGDPAAFADEAIEHSHLLRALAAQHDALLDRAIATRAETLPQIGFKAGWQHLDTQILDRADVATVGIGFEWKLFDGGQTAAQVAALRLKARALEQQMEGVRAELRREVASSVRAIGEAEARLDAGTRALNAADEAAHLARRLFETGLATNAAVLDATRTQAEARLREASARYDRVGTDYRLRHVLGRL